MDDDLKKQALKLIKEIEVAEKDVADKIRWQLDPNDIIRTIERKQELLKIIFKDQSLGSFFILAKKTYDSMKGIRQLDIRYKEQRLQGVVKDNTYTF